ncbi:hypothetical protein YC2023_026725 [Brassica napus]
MDKTAYSIIFLEDGKRTDQTRMRTKPLLGVGFRVSRLGERRRLKVIKISDITEALYRNIILFEQCHRFRCLLLPLYEVPHLLPHIPQWMLNFSLTMGLL